MQHLALGRSPSLGLFWSKRMGIQFPKPMCNRAMHTKVQRVVCQPPRPQQLLQSSEGRNQQNNPSGVRTSHTRVGAPQDPGKAHPKAAHPKTTSSQHRAESSSSFPNPPQSPIPLHSMVEVGKDLWRSFGPTPLSRLSRTTSSWVLNISKDRDSILPGQHPSAGHPGPCPVGF